MARVTFWLRGSYAPAQPTQYRYSNSFFSAAKGTSCPAAQAIRSSCGRPQGFPVSPIFRSAVFTVSGTFDPATYPRRTSTIMSMCSIITGHACMQARQGGPAQIAPGGRDPRHSSVHRPHLVHPAAERSCFHEKSVTAVTPGFSSSSMFGIGWSAPFGREGRRKTLALPVPLWIIFVKGGGGRDPK